MTQKVWAYHYALWRERIPPGWGLLGCLVGALGILLIGSLALSPQSNAIALKGVKAARSGEEWIPSGPPLLRPDWVISKDYAAHGGLTTAGRKYGAVDFAFWGDCHAIGTPIIATHAGIVKLLLDDPTYGNLVYVAGPHYTTTYGHLGTFRVQEGAEVQRGSVLGSMGSSGRSSGPHVDYQVWMDGENLNPMPYCCSVGGIGQTTPQPCR